MEITELINHPERLDRDTLYELRSVIALYPYFQTARLLMLKNLYLLHDPSFDEELRKAAIYITDRKVIFQLVEAAHYKLPAAAHKHNKPTAPKNNSAEKNTSRTISLIDNFLDSIPQEEQKEEKKKRRPTPADAAVDYVAYLLETDSEEKPSDNGKVPLLKGQNLIDSFIENDKGKIVLSDTPQFVPQIEDSEEKEEKGFKFGRKRRKRWRRKLFYRDFSPNLHKTGQIFKGFGNY